MPEKRKCFYVPVDQFDANGYIPSMVTEDEPGHAPMTGNGSHAAPWYWGKTYEEATAVCAKENARLGISPEDAALIVASSMRADDARSLASARAWVADALGDASDQDWYADSREDGGVELIGPDDTVYLVTIAEKP
jgi:hypothetical protein